jgi:hypothetical protein
MLRARHVCCAVLLASCADQPSRLDPTIAAGPVGSAGSDAQAAPRHKPAPDDKPAGDGFDLQSVLAKMAEMVGKPGRYEARH